MGPWGWVRGELALRAPALVTCSLQALGVVVSHSLAAPEDEVIRNP